MNIYGQSVKTFTQVSDAAIPTIANVVAVHGKETTKALMIKFVVDVVNFFTVGKNTNANQLAQVADLITEFYPHLNIADIKFCFTKAKLLQYGELYDRIDGGIIMGWIKRYNDERKIEVRRILDKKEQAERLKQWG